MRARVFKWLLFLAAALVLMLGVLLWGLGREAALRYAFDNLATRSNGMLTGTGIRGGLYEGFAFDSLVIKLPTQTITLTDGSILWQPTAFAYKTMLATHARVGSVSIEITGTSKEPVSEPQSLALPFNLIVPKLRIDNIEIREKTTVTRLAPLDLGLQFRNQRWNVEQLTLTTPWGAIAGTLQLDAAKPFNITGSILVEQKSGELTYRVPVSLAGKLGELDAASNFVVKDMAGKATARITPFAAQPVSAATLDMPHFLPRRWNADWPEADLGMQLVLAPQGEKAWQGTARITNHQTGTLDAGRVPVSTATTRFAGGMRNLRFDDLLIDLGGGGKLAGSGTLQDGKPAFALTAREVNLQGLHKRLRETRIAGDLRVAHDKGTTAVTAALKDGKLALTLDAQVDEQKANILKAQLRAASGSLNLAGAMQLKGTQAFAFTGDAVAFNPAEFGAYPAGNLNAGFKAEGTLSPSWRVVADVALKPSQLAGKPLSGSVRATATADTLSNVDLALTYGTNRLAAKGSMGGATDKITWEVDAKRLTDFHAELSGQVTGTGDLSGRFTAPRGTFALDAKDLKYTEAHRVRELRLRGTIAAPANTADARIEAEATLRDYRGTSFRADTATLRLAGTRADHTLDFTLANRELDLTASARGALATTNHWRGNVTRLENKGNVPVTLRAAATLTASSTTVELGEATLDVGGGRLNLVQLRVAGGTVATRGSASNVPLALANSFIENLRREMNSTLRLGAEWNLALGQSANGTLRVFRESGDVVLRDPRLPLGLTKGEFSAVLADGSLDAKLDMQGAQVGTVRADVNTRVTKRGDTWGIAGDSPLKGSADIDIPTIAWLARFTGQADAELKGALRAKLTAAGSVGKPGITGTVAGTALALVWPQQGVNVKDGVLDAQLTDNNLVIRQFRVAGGSGTLEAEGSVRLDTTQSAGRINVKLAQFEAVSRPDRLVVASGTGSVEFDEKRLVVTGNLKADRGLFELAESAGPTLSDDVVVIGKRRQVEEPQGRKLATRVDLKLDLGDAFRIKGMGIEGRIAGALGVVSTDGGLPRALGSVRIVDGTYNAYGQKLVIERGIITFSGPVDNPGINLLALRKGLAVEAGVEVRGSANAPQARLVSTPSVPETEKLSWLILGRGLDASTQADFSLLSAAASGLLGTSQSASLQSRLANTLGVDEFGVSAPSGTQGGLLTVGKRLSSRLYVTYEQGLGKVSNLLKIRYVLSKRWSVQAQTGTDNAVDAFYTLAFD